MSVDMRPEAIDRRLREMSQLSVLRPPFPSSVDMSAGAVESRLRELSQLFAFGQKLRTLMPTR
jgi:hypothetical protein